MTTGNEWEICTIVHSILTAFLEPTSTSLLFPSPQLTLPEGTQPRWGHTLTSCMKGESRVHMTTFGGCPLYDLQVSDDALPKLADTTVLEFGEQRLYHCNILGFCAHWHGFTVDHLNSSPIGIHLSPIDCLIVCPASCLLVYVVQLLKCNLHCCNVYWL